MNNQLTTQQNNTALLKSVLAAPTVIQEFDRALGKNRGVFEASLIELTSGDPALQKCEPKLLVKEALRAATLGLPLSKSLGFAYIVAFNNSVKQPDGSWAKVMTPTFVVGYKGLIQLAQRTAQYRTINADVVYEGELQKVDKLSGAISLDGQKSSDRIVGYFCHFELLNGFQKTLYMSVEDMAKYAKKYSPSIGRDVTVEMLMAKANEPMQSKQVGWMGNFNDMAVKTCLRRLIGKYGYMSVEIQDAFREEEQPGGMVDARQEMMEAETQTIDLNAVEYQDTPPVAGIPEPMPSAMPFDKEPVAAHAEKTVFDNNGEPDF